MLSIKVSLSLNHLKTRGIGGFKEGEREKVLRASAIRVNLRLAVETELYREARLRPKVLEAQLWRQRGATRGLSKCRECQPK